METKKEIKVGDAFFDLKHSRFLEVTGIDYNAQTRNMRPTRGYFLTAYTQGKQYNVKGMKLESEMRKYAPVPNEEYLEMLGYWRELFYCFEFQTYKNI